MTVHRKLKKIIVAGIATMLFLCGCVQQKNIVEGNSSSVEGPSSKCILEFHGAISVKEVSQPLELYYYQIGDNQYSYEISVGGKKQSFPLREDFDVSTVAQGYDIQDVNQDGHDDLLIELGLYGKCKPWDCLVYSESLGYVEVIGYNELMIPHWSSESGMVVEEWNNGSTQYAINRYRILDSDLVLAECLTWEYIDGEISGYTISKRINGEMMVIADSVKDSEIELDYWYN